MAELLFLQPVFKEAVWGGTKLRDEFGYEVSGENTGECWGISAHPDGCCRILGGSYHGELLSDLWESHPELFGNEDGSLGTQFPLLVKMIDARSDLSIQVHPDDVYAKKYEHGSLGKTECWYVLDCEQDASIVIGHHASGREALKKMIEEHRWEDLIREVPLKKGDFFQINPGCVHAIKGGTLILETQQSSDITYRLYDYGRLWNGQPRKLNISQSIDVIQTPYVPEESQRKKKFGENVDREHLETCGYYIVERYDIHGTWTHKFPGAFVNVSVIDGEGSVDGTSVRKGMHFIIPSGYGICQLEGQFTIICSWVPVPEKNAENPDCITLEIRDWMGRQKAVKASEGQAVLTFEDVYEEGDTIRVTVPENGRHYVVRIDDAMDEALVYMTERKLDFEIPFGEKRKSYNPKAFTGKRHYLTCRPAMAYEVQCYRNLAKNVMDQHGGGGCYPHASANVETRGESVFAARNAIDGILGNSSHGSWPYESWGINRQEDAELLLEFGRPVDMDRLVLWTRADFPHDNWWRQALLTFSDGSQETLTMQKSQKPHVFPIEKKQIFWLKLSNLLSSDEPSPFPALTQIEVYGCDTGR